MHDISQCLFENEYACRIEPHKDNIETEELVTFTLHLLSVRMNSPAVQATSIYMLSSHLCHLTHTTIANYNNMRIWPAMERKSKSPQSWGIIAKEQAVLRMQGREAARKVTKPRNKS